MKTCLICKADCDDAAPSCHACGEGSFAFTVTPAKRQAISAPHPEASPEPVELPAQRPKQGKRR